jgi:type II secretory pathway pseudopilin PulG
VSRPRRGSTLVETIIALVLLSGCLLLVSALLQRSSRYQQRSESLLEAGALADKVISDIRAWAKNGANYDGNWAFWQGRLVNDPDFPNLSARVDVQNTGLTVLSPDKHTELAYSSPREILKGSVLVRVQAGRDLNSPVGRLAIWSLVAPPSPVIGATIVVNTSGTPMAVGETRGFTATAFDGGGRELPQCCFEWRVRNQSGEASPGSQTRDGRSYSISHTRTRDDDDDDTTPEVPAAGTVLVQAEARILGELVIGSATVALDPGP